MRDWMMKLLERLVWVGNLVDRGVLRILDIVCLQSPLAEPQRVRGACDARTCKSTRRTDGESFTPGRSAGAVLRAITNVPSWQMKILFDALTLAVLSITFAANLAYAAGGQCRWEGGLGAVFPPNPNVSDPRASCLKEDCAGNGGYAQCTEPKIVPANARTDAESDGEKWSYQMCDWAFGSFNSCGQGASWCQAAGGDGVWCQRMRLLRITFVDYRE
jgi:hypothetical protein